MAEAEDDRPYFIDLWVVSAALRRRTGKAGETR